MRPVVGREQAPIHTTIHFWAESGARAAAYTYTLDATGNRSAVLKSNGQSAGGMPSRASVASGAVSANGSRGSITAFVGGTARLPFTQGAGGGVSLAATVGISYTDERALSSPNIRAGLWFVLVTRRAEQTAPGRAG